MKKKVLLKVKKVLASMLVMIMCLSTINITALAEGLVEVAENVAGEDTGVTDVINDENVPNEELTEDITSEEPQTVSVFEKDGVKYTFTLYSSWNTGYNASIRIDNNTEEKIDDWKIEMLYDGSISSVWNAVIVSGENGKYIIKNADWNQDIDAGSYVEFGLSGQESFINFPTSFAMLNSMTVKNSEDYSIEYSITNDWGAGFTGRVVINNNSEVAIEDWILEFDSENEISSAWDCVILSNEGSHYVVKNPGYNQNIAPGSSVSFGFNVNEKVSENELSNYELKSFSEYVKEQEEEEEIIPDPEEEENLDEEQEIKEDEESEEADYIVPEPANFDHCPEPGEFESIGEAYVKEATWDDIITDESGIQYVKNQILISAYMGADKEIFEEIADEIGANIVGYIELTNDYQLEFTEGKTFEELNTIIDYLNSYSFISTVTLNYAYEIETEEKTNDKLYNDKYYCVTEKNVYDYDKDLKNDITNTKRLEGTVFVDTLVERDKKDKYVLNEKYNSKTDALKTAIYKDDWNETTPNGDNWGLEALNVLSAWDYIDNSSSVKVGVFDVGFATKHEDLEYAGLANNVEEEVIEVYDEESNTKKEEYISKHGTHVAGIISAIHNNEKGISGVATNVELYAYGFGEKGQYTPYQSIMRDKLAFANLIGNHVKVINVSLGYKYEVVYKATNNIGNNRELVEDEAACMEEFFEKMILAGYDFVICVAAGNTNKDYPYKVDAKFDHYLTNITKEIVKKRIIVVGAIRQNVEHDGYNMAGFSNPGERVDVCAPGVDILSTVPLKYDPCGYALLEGTTLCNRNSSANVPS